VIAGTNGLLICKAGIGDLEPIPAVLTSTIPLRNSQTVPDVVIPSERSRVPTAGGRMRNREGTV